jgi:hypothetical protein
MTPIDDLWPEQQFFFRSDHYNFARRGVPALFFFNGVHEDYHEPSDSPDRIDAEKAARIGKLVFYLGLALGDADERPRWDPESYRAIVRGSPGDEAGAGGESFHPARVPTNRASPREDARTG